MAHTDPENVIPQKPPPPPDRRTPQPSELPVDPQAPTQPDRIPPQTPIEAPPGQPIAPRVAVPHSHAAGPGSRRATRKASDARMIVPAPELREEIISRATRTPARGGSSPDLMLLAFPSSHVSRGGSASPPIQR
jgi:hypothetical protein